VMVLDREDSEVSVDSKLFLDPEFVVDVDS
jgi:hypothetical protein